VKNNPDDAPLQKSRMEWLAKAMGHMQHYDRIEECFVFEYETVEEKSYFEAFDKADFQSYLMCPFDSDEGKDLKWSWSSSQN